MLIQPVCPTKTDRGSAQANQYTLSSFLIHNIRLYLAQAHIDSLSVCNTEKLVLNSLSSRFPEMTKYQREISFKNRYKTNGIQGRAEVNVIELFSFSYF